MKKIGFIILGFVIGAVLTYYFCPRQVEIETAEIKIIKPNGVISNVQAKALNKNWTDFRKAAVDSAAKKQGRNKDNRWSWWSIDDIENYIAFSKNQADSLGNDITGLRVYLGVYGKNAGQSKKDLTTMFLVPTVKKSVSTAGMGLSFSQIGNPKDCLTCSPLNDGAGGGGDYPQ